MDAQKIGNCLDVQYKDDKELFNTLLSVLGYTKGKFALKFDVTEDAISNWTREGRDVPKWALVYLIDTLSLELQLTGYILKIKKMTTLTNDIVNLQDKIIDIRMESSSEFAQTPININIDDFISEDKPMNIDILVNCRNILEKFYDENKE